MTFDLTFKWSISVELTEPQEAWEIVFLFAESLSWTGAILSEICFVSYISHQNYNSQGEWRSDREVWHQGQGSHLKVTFQSTQQMLPIYLSSALSPSPHFTSLSLSLSLRLSLPLYLAFSFGLLLIPSSYSFAPLLTSPPSTIPRSVTCWRGSREEAV